MKKFLKRGSIEFETIIVLIIAIIIIILLIYLTFNSNILSWFSNLPGYNEVEDKTIDNLPEDEQIKINYFKVAVVKKDSISFCTNNDCNILRNSNLYVKGNEKEGSIYLLEKGYFGVDLFDIDDKVGVFKESKVILNPGFDRGAKENKGLPLKEDMINLHNSIYISGILYKDKKVSLIETGKLDETRDIKIIINYFKTPIILRYLRADRKWQWSEFVKGEKQLWLFVDNEENSRAKELKNKDRGTYNFVLSFKDFNNEDGIRFILNEVLKKKGNAVNSRFMVLVDNDDNYYSYNSDSPEIGNYVIFIRSIGAEKYEN